MDTYLINPDLSPEELKACIDLIVACAKVRGNPVSACVTVGWMIPVKEREP